MIEQKSVKKYFLYAFGEILLVVIGILLALQINDWSEDRTKEKEKFRILKNFDRDLGEDIYQLKKNIAKTRIRMQQIDSIFVILNGEGAYPMNDLVRFNTGITKGDLFELNSGTYDESLSSGKINYIRPDTLREQVFAYYRSVNSNLTQENSYRILIETIIPKWGAIVIPTKEAMDYLGLKSEMPPMNVKELASNKEYNTLLALTFGNHVTLIQLWEGYIRKASRLKENIESVIAQSSD